MRNTIEDFNLINFSNDNPPNNNAAIADIFAILWRKRFWFALSIILSFFLSVIYVRSTQKIYASTAVILIKDDKIASDGGVSEAAAFQDMFSFGTNSVYNEIGILRSRRLMTAVVMQLKLESNYQIEDGLRSKDLYTSSPIQIEYLDEIAQNSTYDLLATPLGGDKVEFKYAVAQVNENGEVGYQNYVSDIVFNQYIIFQGGMIRVIPTSFMSEEWVGNPILVSKKKPKETAKSYGLNLSVVSADKQSSLVKISITDINPSRAEDIINTLIDVYEKNTIEEKSVVLTNTINFITEKIKFLENDLKRIDSDIESYRKKHKLTSISAVSSMYLDRYARLTSDALGLDNQLNIANYMKEYLQENDQFSVFIPANIGINSEAIEIQIAQYNEAIALRNRFLANSSSSNSVVKNLYELLVSTRSSILNSLDNLIASREIQLKKNSQDEKASISRIASVSSLHKYMINIDRQLKLKEELYLYLLKKQDKIEIQRTTTESNCIVVDVADGSTVAIAPNKMQILLICLLLGFIIPAVCLYVSSLLRTKVYTQKDIKDATDVPFMGELPYEKITGENSIVVERGNRDIINESFRLLLDHIEIIDVDGEQQGKTILLTSLNSSTGKTFVAINLAVTMSLSNARVILLDVDMRKASLTKRFGFDKKQAGISTYLSGKVDSIDEIIHHYGESQFSVISSGELTSNPSKLLKNMKFKKLISTLRERYDYIIMDSAPYGLVTDTSLCAKFTDITVMILRSGVFDKRQFSVLTELYETDKLPKLNVLLNRVNRNKGGNVYSYRYGYKYKVKKNVRYWIRKILGI